MFVRFDPLIHQLLKTLNLPKTFANLSIENRGKAPKGRAQETKLRNIEARFADGALVVATKDVRIESKKCPQLSRLALTQSRSQIVHNAVNENSRSRN